MREITLEELLEAGCHFGHQVTRQNPKARDFVFEARDNIHIIDLAKTKEELDTATSFVKSLAQKGGTMVVIGTKRQAKPVVEEEFKRMREVGVDGIYTVTNRWIGGLLTNFSEVAKNFKKLKSLTERLKDPEEKAKYTKKEVGQWQKEKNKLESFYGGVFDMTRIPDALFIIDTHLEDLAVKEAARMNVTTVGIVDTNADPTAVVYPIPANDDAVGSIQLIAKHIFDAWIEGAQSRQDETSLPASEAKTGADKKQGAKQEEKKDNPKAEKVESAEKPKAKRARKPKTVSVEALG
ncbi:MAG: 30S ribosomal protein S2, partial [Candidatus Levybacteria bacterium]|nr:30S ribosomal protein S2 [Candidatus Levybacteria bacterium]